MLPIFRFVKARVSTSTKTLSPYVEHILPYSESLILLCYIFFLQSLILLKKNKFFVKNIESKGLVRSLQITFIIHSTFK